MERRRTQGPKQAISAVEADRKLQERDSETERKIRAALEAGEFDNLPGYGKPLPKDPSGGLAGDSWLAHHTLKQAGFAPEWILLRKEIADERPAVSQALSTFRQRAADDATASELEALEAHYIALAAAINKKIDRHNLTCPPTQTLIRFVDDATRRWK